MWSDDRGIGLKDVTLSKAAFAEEEVKAAIIRANPR